MGIVEEQMSSKAILQVFLHFELKYLKTVKEVIYNDSESLNKLVLSRACPEHGRMGRMDPNLK
jgi:hypothetical protein